MCGCVCVCVYVMLCYFLNTLSIVIIKRQSWDGRNLDNSDAILMIDNSSHTSWMAVSYFCHLVQDVGVVLFTNDSF